MNACVNVNLHIVGSKRCVQCGFFSCATGKSCMCTLSVIFSFDICMFLAEKKRNKENHFLAEWCGGVSQDFLPSGKLLRGLAACTC